MATIGDRIRIKRKELGLTQVELGERLRVTDRAVSKWEQNEGNPDFSLLPQLAEILDVTLDYLITGKIIEPVVNLDDMDATKRAIYLAERDDVENFIKYGYVKTSNLCNDAQRGFINESPIKKAIYEHQSVKIFSAIMDEFLKIRPIQWYGLYTVMPYIYDDIDDFVRLCALANRADVLDYIGYFTFNIVHSKQARTDKRMRTWTINESAARMYRFEITKETFAFPFTDERIPENMVLYFSTLHFTPIKFGGVTFRCVMNDGILGQLYKTKRFDLLNKALDTMRENLSYGLQHKDLVDREQLRVDLIDDAYGTAKDTLDIKWLRIFNDYNKEVVQKMGIGRSFLTDEDFAYYELKAKPGVSQDELLVASNVRLGLIQYNVLQGNGKTVGELRQQYDRNKHIYESIIKNNFIHYMEFIECCISEKDYKRLFQFACDYEIKELEDAVLSTNDKEIIRVGKALFVPDEDMLRELNRTLETIMTYKKQAELSKRYDFQRSAELEQNVSKLRTRWEDIASRKKDCPRLGELIKRQNITFPFRKYNDILVKSSASFNKVNVSIESSLFEYCTRIKEQYFIEVQEGIENAIEKLTHDKEILDEYQGVVQTITEEYLSKLLQNGETELFIIKLCARMDAELKFKRYEGEDFFGRMDAFFKKNVPESKDCDDGWGYSTLDTAWEDSQVKPWQRRRDLFNRLRMQRNNIAHPNSNEVKPLTKDELKECLEFVISLKK